MQVLLQAARVLGVGAALGVAGGLLFGFPSVPTRAEADVCLPPGSEAQGAPHSALRWVTQEDAQQRVGEPAVAFVDARPRDAFVAGHIAGALSAPMDQGTVPDEVVDALRGAATVITYCDTSGDCAGSVRLARLLATAGLHDVRVLEGGMPAWLDNELPAEAGECRLCP